MKVIVEPYDYSPCTPRVFTINGIRADYYDFGTCRDRKPKQAEDHCCCDCKFKRDKRKTKTAMRKYNLTYDEYCEVCDVLEAVLDVGECGYCS